jgi:MFS family permease
MTRAQLKVVVAASLGTVFEWYDFFLYGSLVAFLSTQFFPKQHESAALLSALATFGAGFAVRPLGALVFGRIGDLVGRKRTFLITIIVMGASTALIGVLPVFDAIGWWAPVLLVFLRLTQGLALGGEYGGAAVYVAEHAPAESRGYQTSYINATASFGFLLSIVAVLACRVLFGDDAFRAWGWRVPFLFSILLLAISVYIRMQLEESPIFAELRGTGRLSAAPLRESFLNRANRRLVLIAIAGIAGTTVVFYAAQFYALVFLQATLRIDFQTASILVGVGVLIGVPLHLLAGALSDRFGRRRVMIYGMALGAVVLLPSYAALIVIGNPELARARATVPVALLAEPYRPFAGDASAAANELRAALTGRGVSYTREAPRADGQLAVRIGDTELIAPGMEEITAALSAAGFPESSSLPPIHALSDIRFAHVEIVLVIALMMACVAAMYGPIAAFLVELFPTRIRYTSLSFPYHITTGWLGGFMPFVAASIVLLTGNVLAGLYYPIGITAAACIVSWLVMPETRGRDLRADHAGH